MGKSRRIWFADEHLVPLANPVHLHGAFEAGRNCSSDRATIMMRGHHRDLRFERTLFHQLYLV